MLTTGNLFSKLQNSSGNEPDQEIFEALFSSGNVRLERIISTGQATPEGQWYDQEEVEWVALLTGHAELSFENGDVLKLQPGDYVLIPPHLRHRVTSTSVQPPAVWLALFHKPSAP